MTSVDHISMLELDKAGLSEKELAAGNPQPVKMNARGHYAYQIVWNDGHDTGIFTLELLRQLSEPK